MKADIYVIMSSVTTINSKIEYVVNYCTDHMPHLFQSMVCKDFESLQTVLGNSISYVKDNPKLDSALMIEYYGDYKDVLRFASDIKCESINVIPIILIYRDSYLMETCRTYSELKNAMRTTELLFDDPSNVHCNFYILNGSDMERIAQEIIYFGVKYEGGGSCSNSMTIFV